MRHVWILACLFACTASSGTTAGGDDDGDPVTCSVSLEGTHCDPAQAYCAIEGQPSCTALPTSGGCNCTSDGIWRCYCACYGPQSTCEDPCPPTSTRAIGAMCNPAGYQCAYPDRTCTCTDDPDRGLVFVCT